MKKLFLTSILLFGMMAGLFAQCGFVAAAYDDGTTRSAASVGQMFTLGISVGGNYANEGLQQSFLYHGVAAVREQQLPRGLPPRV